MRKKNQAFDSRKHVIVIGLCGESKAGCAAAARILHSPYPELDMDQEKSLGISFEGVYREREQEIIKNFAQKQWEPFEMICSDALLTAHVLAYAPGQLADFLSGMAKEELRPQGAPDGLALCRKFFGEAMYLDLSPDQEASGEGWADGKTDAQSLFEALCRHTMSSCREAECFLDMLCSCRTAHPGEADFTGTFFCKMSGDGEEAVKISFVPGTAWIRIANVDLYHLFSVLRNRWQEREAPVSPLYYFVLKEYLYCDLPRWTDAFWHQADSLGYCSGRAKEALCRNLWSCREPYASESQEQEADGQPAMDGQTILAEDMDASIRLLRYCHHLRKDIEGKMRNTRVVIDSIRNPSESRYLSSRCSNYYLFGIYAGKAEAAQQPEDSGDMQCYRSRCLELADVYFHQLATAPFTAALVRYVCLIMHPGLVLPTPVERNMQIACSVKLNSGCLSRQVGAVLTDAQFHLLSVGWNQQPEGQFPCSYRDMDTICHSAAEDKTCRLMYSDFELGEDFKRSLDQVRRTCQAEEENGGPAEDGMPAYYCFKDIYNSMTGEKDFSYARSLHAEENAFLNLRTNAAAAKGGYLFTTSSPCVSCAKMAMQLQISRIYYVEQYPGIQNRHVLSAGVPEGRPEMILMAGAVGKAYMQLYTPEMPLKDETELRMGRKMTELLTEEP